MSPSGKGWSMGRWCRPGCWTNSSTLMTPGSGGAAGTKAWVGAIGTEFCSCEDADAWELLPECDRPCALGRRSLTGAGASSDLRKKIWLVR